MIINLEKCKIVLWMFGIIYSPYLHASGSNDINLMSPDKIMVGWTWITFLILLILLHQFAWKPIFNALETREDNIRKSVENAQRIKEDLAQMDEKREKIIRDADERAKEIVAAARNAAVEASKVIDTRAKEEAKIMLENAKREIHAAQEKATAKLRRESAELAVALAGKLINENLDTQKNQLLIDRLIKEI